MADSLRSTFCVCFTQCMYSFVGQESNIARGGLNSRTAGFLEKYADAAAAAAIHRNLQFNSGVVSVILFSFVCLRSMIAAEVLTQQHDQSRRSIDFR